MDAKQLAQSPGGAVGGPPTGGFGGGPPGARGGLMLLSPPVLIGVSAVFLVITALSFWLIYRKAGYSGLLGLLMLIPGVNLAMMLWFASTEWPTLKSLREQRALVAMHESEAAEGAAVHDAAAVQPV